MDLERIKQNLRLRSGRSKKTKKAAQVAPASTTKQANGEAPQPIPAQASNQKKPREPSSRPQDSHSAQDHDNEYSDPTPRREGPKASAGNGQAPSPGDETVHDYTTRGGNATDQNVAEYHNTDDSEAVDFDLRPPTAKSRPPSLESLSVELFSAGHLDTILHNSMLLGRFTAFINKYTPKFYPTLIRYLELQKAIKAVEYANAVAEGIKLEDDNAAPTSKSAATLDSAFQETSSNSFHTLVSTVLPMYITYNLVKMVSECLVDEITGRQTPIMRDLVGGLSEVFCLADPRQEDNPIVYASEEFYRLTGYGRDDVVGNNCRFLQGAKTNRDSVARLKENTRNGIEICETLLNYRRDGRPFINLLMIAPLLDDKGNVKYHIGAQVDVSRLVEGGKALESFERHLGKRQALRRDRGRGEDNDEEARRKKALSKLKELSEMFDLEESAVVQSHSRANSMSGDGDDRSIGSRGSLRARRRLVDSEPSDDEDEELNEQEKADWKLGQSDRSGKLPGVYDTYMLVRPAPSLRVIFASPKLRRLGDIIQSPFLSHIAAPSSTLSGLKDSFSTGSPVSARVNFMAKRSERRDGTPIGPGTRHEDGSYGRACWISATPLLGDDDRVGVWMVVVVQKSKAPRRPKKQEAEALAVEGARRSGDRGVTSPASDMPENTASPKDVNQDELPIKPTRLEDNGLGEQEPTQPDAPESPTNEGEQETQEIAPESQNDTPESAHHQEESAHQQEGSAHQQEDGEEFIQTRERRPPNTPQRVHIQSDSDDEQDTPVTARKPDRTYSQNKNNSEENNVDENDVTTPPGEIPPSIPSDAQFEDASDTVSPASEPPVQEDQSKTPSSAARSPDEEHTAGQSPRTPYMDYLRHPGSRSNAEYARATSASGFTPAMGLRDYGDSEDIDCGRSPYSVD